MNEEERKILSLRFVVVALVFLGLAGIEGPIDAIKNNESACRRI
jgi:cbb3-type cytochrome oxidase subunit 1